MKLTMAERGRIGGLVKAIQPEDHIQGDPLAKVYARRLGHRGPRNVPATAELYEENAAISIILVEKYLERLRDITDERPNQVKAVESAEKVIQILRAIGWREHGKQRTLVHAEHEAIIYTSAMVLIGLVGDAPKE